MAATLWPLEEDHMAVDERNGNGTIPVIGRQWLTVHYEQGEAQVVAHAVHGFGAREAAAHVVVDASAELLAACQVALNEASEDAMERALDAASEHRTLARNRGEDHRAPLESVGFEEITAEEGIYSDPRLMDMPVRSRQRALERSQQAMGGQEASDD